MKVRDKTIKQSVNVADRRCLGCSCYWPRPDPGVFTLGQGYRSRGGGKPEWVCGTRDARGCPYNKKCVVCGTTHPEYETCCRGCGSPLERERIAIDGG